MGPDIVFNSPTLPHTLITFAENIRLLEGYANDAERTFWLFAKECLREAFARTNEAIGIRRQALWKSESDT